MKPPKKYRQHLQALLSEAEAEAATYLTEVTIDHKAVVVEYRINLLRELLGIRTP